MQTILKIVKKPMETAAKKSTRIDSWLLASVIPIVCATGGLHSQPGKLLPLMALFLLLCKQSEVLCGPLWSSGQDVWFSHLTSSGLLEQHQECHRWTCHLFWFRIRLIRNICWQSTIICDTSYMLNYGVLGFHVLWCRQLKRQARDAKLPTSLVLICLVLLIRL